MAKTAVFGPSIDATMLDALKNDRVDIVKNLIKTTDFKMNTFLTISRLESLYNTDKGPMNTLGYIVKDVTRTNIDYKYNLPDIGLALEKLMGGAYESHYCSREFKTRWTCSKIDKLDFKSRKKEGSVIETKKPIIDFKYPYNDLFIWAVLTKRHEMALVMWRHGEEALTKALVAVRLYNFLAYEASDDYLDQEICEDYFKYARDFQQLSLQMLEECYQSNHNYTLYLLTYELENWGKQTNLSLAVVAFHQEFLAHTCCQFLLSDLWLGGLRIRRCANFKIVVALFLPAFIFALNFKSHEELLRQPQRPEEIIGAERSDYEYLNLGSSFTKKAEGDDDSSVPRSRYTNSAKQKLELLKSRRYFQSKTAAQLSTVGQRIKSTYRCSYKFNELQRPLSPRQKIYEFIVAPLTTFWIWTISYCFFLGLLSFTVLTDVGKEPHWQEYYMMAYVITLAFENFRRIIISEGRSFWWKVNIYFQHYWNWVYAIAILFFFAAMIFRCLQGMLPYARLCYACDSVFWYILLLDLMTVHFQIGVYIIMLKKMIIGMLQVLSILAVVLISFGIVRQSIHYPHDDWDWETARNIVYKPYFMLYGEVYATEIDTCTDFDQGCDVLGYWLTPIYMSVFMLISNILVLNLMIAVFNHIFSDINAISQQVWRFYRYSVVLDYEYKPFLPPPLIIVYHIYFLFTLLFRKKKQGHWFDFALKLFLNAESIVSIQEFENDCVKRVHALKKITKLSTVDEKLQRVNDKLDKLSKQMNLIFEALAKGLSPSSTQHGRSTPNVSFDDKSPKQM